MDKQNRKDSISTLQTGSVGAAPTVFFATQREIQNTLQAINPFPTMTINIR